TGQASDHDRYGHARPADHGFSVINLRVDYDAILGRHGESDSSYLAGLVELPMHSRGTTVTWHWARSNALRTDFSYAGDQHDRIVLDAGIVSVPRAARRLTHATKSFPSCARINREIGSWLTW